MHCQGTLPMATACDSLEVDLSRTDLEVTWETQPCIDVDVEQVDITIEAVTVANQGPKGDQGEDGKDGQPGPMGPPGNQGLAATIAVGSTVTGAPGTDAAVQNAGSTSQAVFNFTIPRGDVGPTGPQGQGILIKGTVPTSANLPTTGNTVGDLWIALDTGHGWSWNGTTWVDTGPIQGPPGATGPAGPIGNQGPQGNPGAAATV